MYTKLSMVECHSIDTLDQYLIDTWLIPWLHRHSINTWCWSSQVIFADIPLSVKQYIHAWIGWHSTNYTVLANCQSSVDWDIDWVSAKYRLRCPLSVHGVLSDGVNRHPNCGCFQHTRFEKCILYHTRFIYLLELNSQLAVSVFSFCLPCLEKGKWPFDRTRIIQMYNDHCRVTSNIMFANAHLYTWVEKGTKNTTQCPQPGLMNLDCLVRSQVH